jgi:flagellar hook assembly protein FlgD
VELQVFDAAGRAVRTLAQGRMDAGTHTATWNGRDDSGRELAHGIYFVRLVTPDSRVELKTILAR